MPVWCTRWEHIPPGVPGHRCELHTDYPCGIWILSEFQKERGIRPRLACDQEFSSSDPLLELPGDDGTCSHFPDP